MASAIIHMAIASEVNKSLNRSKDKLLIGSIAPDLSKQMNETKVKSHFLNDENDDLPNIDKFLAKYRNKMNDDFVLGYFIHLYTDYLWFKYFIPEIYDGDNNMISKMDGSIIKCNGNMLCMYIYSDYTNLNIRLLDEYNLDLSIFCKDLPYLENIIDEIQMDKIQLIIDKMSVIIANTKTRRALIFDIENIKEFINLSVKLTVAKLKELNII